MSSCGVCLSGADEYFDFYDCTYPTARKPHKCVECGQTIQPGQRYQRVAGKYGGAFYAEKSCACCAEIRTTFTCEGGELVGDMWDEMTDYVFPELTTVNECFRKLSPASKEFLLAKWRKWKGLL